MTQVIPTPPEWDSPGNRSPVLDRGNQCVVADQGLIEVHAYSLAGYIDNHRAHTVERAERASMAVLQAAQEMSGTETTAQLTINSSLVRGPTAGSGHQPSVIHPVHWKVKEGHMQIGELAKPSNTSAKTIRFY